MPVSAFLAWTAGLFEGEGTVTITRSGRRGYTRPVVMLTSTDEQVIAELQGRWPGYIRRFQPKGNAKPAATWCINTRPKMARFLFDILPFLRTDRVKQKVELALEDIGARVQGTRGNKEYMEQCHERRERMAALNKRGRA